MSFLALLLLASSARGDVVPPEPKDCVEGSEGHTCHGGAHCRPATCQNDASCTGGLVCQELHLCIAKLNCGGMGGPYYVDSVKGACPGGAPCVAGTCTPVRVCTRPAQRDSPLRLDGRTRSDGKPLQDSRQREDGQAAGDGAAPQPRGCRCELAVGVGPGELVLCLFGLVLVVGAARLRARSARGGSPR